MHTGHAISFAAISNYFDLRHFIADIIRRSGNVDVEPLSWLLAPQRAQQQQQQQPASEFRETNKRLTACAGELEVSSMSD